MLETAATHGLYEATRRSLQAVPKELPAVWLYDERGSRLYEEITRLPEYYLPRREAEILRARAPVIAERTEGRTLVELGSGSARNTGFLLDALSGTLERYVPFDVSEHALRASAETIAAGVPGDLGRHRSPATSSATSARCRARGRGWSRSSVARSGTSIRRSARGFCARCAVELGRRRRAAPRRRPGQGRRPPRGGLRRPARRDGGVRPKRARCREPRARRDVRAAPVRLRPSLGPRQRVDGHRPSRVERRTSSRSARLGLELGFDEGERLRVEISSKFRRGAFEAGARARRPVTVEAWWTDAAGEFAVVLARPLS